MAASAPRLRLLLLGALLLLGLGGPRAAAREPPPEGDHPAGIVLVVGRVEETTARILLGSSSFRSPSLVCALLPAAAIASPTCFLSLLRSLSLPLVLSLLCRVETVPTPPCPSLLPARRT